MWYGELERLHILCEKRVNVCCCWVLQGIGKSHLLDNYHREKIIRMDDFRSPKQTLGDCS
ncbi:MAG: hypothetical protein H6573_19170 [Lewinellaceae bacterium]|nr:hypothetical protein [Lewinellaceae bacterium]